VPAAEIIKLFGGIRPMANKLDVPVSTVQGWKERAAIPANRHDEILAAAARHKVNLPPELLKLSDSEGTAGEAPAAAAGHVSHASRADQAGRDAAAESAPTGTEPASPGSAEAEGAEAEGTGKASDDIEAGPETTAPPPAASGRSGNGALVAGAIVGAVILVFGAGVAVVARDTWLPLFGVASSAGDAQADVAGLKDRVAAFESSAGKKIDALTGSVEKLSAEVQKAGSGSGVAEKTLGEITASIEGLKSRVAALESASQSASAANANELSSLSGTQENLANRLSGVEQEVGGVGDLKQEVGRLSEKLADIRQSANADGAILLAALQLRDAVRGSEPFEAQYDALQTLSRKDEKLAAIIEPLKPYAATGVATLEELRATFPPVASAVVAVQRGSDAGDGWISGAVRRFSEVVTVRPVGLVEGDDPGSAAARAEFYLNSGDLAAAVKELDSLSPEAAAPAADWRAKADARLAVNDALADVADLVASRLSKLGD